jgi:hypothetical protein
MKRIKKLLLLVMIILLSGCSVEYNLTINEDSSVNEKVVAKEVTNRMKANTGLGEDQSVNYLYKMFDRNSLKTKINTIEKDSTTISTVTGSHKSLDKYAKNFSSDVFDEAIVERDGNKVTLIFDQSKVLSSTATRGLIYDDITVNITVPFKVLEHNADTYKKDTYTWEIKKDAKLRQIKITYDESNLINSKTFSIGDLKFNVSYVFIVVAIIVLIVLTIVAVVYVNNKKNNKI